MNLSILKSIFNEALNDIEKYRINIDLDEEYIFIHVKDDKYEDVEFIYNYTLNDNDENLLLNFDNFDRPHYILPLISTIDLDDYDKIKTSYLYDIFSWCCDKLNSEKDFDFNGYLNNNSVILRTYNESKSIYIIFK
jgi:hypothetical protein